MTEKRKRRLLALLSFALPGLVMLWVYACVGIAPFGDRTVLVSDMSIQYVEFFCALKNGDLFFSWSKALGTGYIGVFSYYVSSPLSILTLLAPNEAMPVALALLTVLKIGLAGLSFCVFAQRRFPGCGVAALACAVCYGLMSYNAAYSLCIMWLDAEIWLPVILLALERVLAGRGAGPFVAALTVCFISTWYISYMVGIFCALYLCVRLIGLKPKKPALYKVLKRFFGGAVCALGLTAWLWLPTLLAMAAGKLNGVNFSSRYTGLVTCNPILLLGQFLPGRYGSISYGALPYVFCGTAVLLLVLIHFSFEEPYGREKLAERGLLLVLALSMILSPLDRVWHMFQHPNWFPFRYAFLLSFFMLYLSVQALPGLLAAISKRGQWAARGAAICLVAAAVLDMGLNMRGFTASLQEQYGSDSYQAYRSNYTASAQLTDAAKADSGGRFFRMGSLAERGLNAPLSFGYPGISHYSSFYNYKVNAALKGLGFAQSWYWCLYGGSTPVTDALLDIEYVISPGEVPGYRQVEQADGLKLWKNPHTLPLAFCPESAGEALLGDTPFERQNALLARLSGADGPVFAPVPAGTEERAGETVLTIVGTGKPLYMDLSASGLREVLVNGEHLLWLGSNEAASVHYLGTPNPGEEWTVTIRHDRAWTGTVWALDLDALRAAVKRLDNVEVTSVGNGGRVSLSVPAAGSRTLCTTIPAEDGWAAYVDGVRMETGRWLDTFLMLELPEGAHEVELRYTPPGLIPGVALGALAAAGLAAAFAIGYQTKKKYNAERRDAP